MSLPPLWAVHLPDGFLTEPWWLGGLVLAALLALYGAWGMREDEVAPTALLTAGFFVASLVHIPLPLLPTSIHLLLNGLLGVLLGRRAAVAIPVGLALQALLLGHGGFLTLGVNSCVMAIPALLVGAMFPWLQRPELLRRAWFRSGLVALSALTWLLSLAVVVGLLLRSGGGLTPSSLHDAARWAVQPWVLLGAGLLTVLVVVGERRLSTAPEFPLGLLLGEMAVLLTVVLNGVVLVLGMREDWQAVALLVVVGHLPLAVFEGVVLGFAVGFLAQVKPELLRRPGCPVASGPSS